MTAQPNDFPPAFNHGLLRLMTDGSDQAYFGLDVLGGLVKGITDYQREHQQAGHFRTFGPALLGAFLWLDDPELIQVMADYPSLCVVVSKQPASTSKRRRNQQETFDKLREVCDSGKGFPAEACPELRGLAPRENGKPMVVGPYTSLPEIALPAFRSIGPRKIGNHLVPILHTKMVLLGNMWWHDEHPSGYPEDIIGFTPERLWLASANGTRSSRSNLEFGVWLTDPKLIATARRFLLEVISTSEDIDPANDQFEPELVPYEEDDAAMSAAYAAEREAAADFEADDYLP
jgi:hypothetical protein